MDETRGGAARLSPDMDGRGGIAALPNAAKGRGDEDVGAEGGLRQHQR
jgi:hypothetical protein